MKSFYKRIVLASLLVIIAGCSGDFLQRSPIDQISKESVAEDEGYARAYLYRLYTYMPNGYGGRATGVDSPGYGYTYLLDATTDIAVSKSGWVNSWQVIVPGKMNPSNNPLNNWAKNYEAIYKANNLISILQGENKLDQALTQRFIAEARFIRAFQYFDLVRRYGDVPLVKEVQSKEDLESLLVPRTPKAEVYDFIDDEFTSVAEILPSAANLPDSELGRATKEAAWAFNGRAMLFAERYERSAQLSNKVIESGVFALAENYNELFQSYGGNKEVIFEMLFNGNEKGTPIDQLALPFSFRSDWGSQINPTQEFVDSYEMRNGLSIDNPNSGYDPGNPYVNRDKRFAWTVLYQGAEFMGEKMDLVYTWSSEKQEYIPTGEDAPLRTGLHSISGYYINKFMDQSAPFGIQMGEGQQSWKEMRLGEVLLNYAEAQNEAAGPDQSVYDAVNKIRARAGLPGLPAGLSREEMFERIKHERKIELALEGHRFWDIRRWNIAEEILDGKTFHGVKPIVDKDSGEIRYEEYPIDFRPQHVFLPRNYLFPIPQSEIEKNPKLTQNPGY